MYIVEVIRNWVLDGLVFIGEKQRIAIEGTEILFGLLIIIQS
jgi:hypothetical protein